MTVERQIPKDSTLDTVNSLFQSSSELNVNIPSKRLRQWSIMIPILRRIMQNSQQHEIYDNRINQIFCLLPIHWVARVKIKKYKYGLIVEGNTDKTALEKIFKVIYKHRDIRFCYFMSSNLDHALYNQQNLSDEDKKKYADAFYEKFLGVEKYFIDFLKFDAVNGVPDNFPASWRYIKEDLRSLERHTNLHIYFLENPYE